MNLYRNYSVFWLVGLAMALGCNQHVPSGVAVHGSVTVDTVPLEEGLITLVPVGGTTGQKCSVVIQSGQYTFDPAQGLSAGEYRVEVMGFPPGIKAMAEGKPVSHSPSQNAYREIAPQFNEKSVLNCHLEEGRDNVADFQVKYVQ